MEAVVLSHRQRTYPVPEAVREEAARGLLRARAYSAQVDDASVAVATILSSGGSLTADFVPLISDYFMSHEPIVSSGAPCAGKIEWSLWGGNPARKWSEKIAREGQNAYEATVASALELVGYDESFTYLGLCEKGAPDDTVKRVVRSRGDSLAWDSLDAQTNVWAPMDTAEVQSYEAIELDSDLVGFVASCFQSGVDGVVLQYGVPITFLPESVVASTLPPVDDVIGSHVYAVVDSTDSTAVLNVIRISPGPVVSVRDKNSWVPDAKMLESLRGFSPPSLVELAGGQMTSVLQQVDMWSAANPTVALEPQNEAKAARAVKSPAVTASASQAELRALEDLWDQRILAACENDRGEALLMKRAAVTATAVRLTSELRTQLNVLELVANAPIRAGGGQDRNRGNAETLRRYWLHGKGAAKIAWGTHGDWTRCVAHLTKYLGTRARGYCQLRHIEANGYATGSRLNK